MAILYKLNNGTKGILYGDNEKLLPNTDYYTYKKIDDKELEKIRDLTWEQVDIILNKYIK